MYSRCVKNEKKILNNRTFLGASIFFSSDNFLLFCNVYHTHTATHMHGASSHTFIIRPSETCFFDKEKRKKLSLRGTEF